MNKIMQLSTKTKIFMALALLYLVSPIDFIPDFFLGIGELDDMGVTALTAFKAYKEYKKLEMNNEA